MGLVLWQLLLVAAATTIVAGCGNGGGSESTAQAGTAQVAAAGNYLPLTVGTVWTYNITAVSGATGQGTVTVEAAENSPSAAQPSLRVHTILLDGGIMSWEQTSGSAVVRFEEQQLNLSGGVVVDKNYSPPIVVLDESAAHMTAGAAWTEQYKELKTPGKGKATKETAEWTVEAVTESVTVPAGTYSCIRVRRNHTTSTPPTETTGWYAAGIGKVKETGAGQNNDQTLELASVSTH